MTVKLAVMGAGLIGKRHAEHVAAEPGANLSAIVDPSTVGRDLAERLGTRWYASFAELAAVEKPDGVIIATPNQLLSATVLRSSRPACPPSSRSRSPTMSRGRRRWSRPPRRPAFLCSSGTIAATIR